MRFEMKDLEKIEYTGSLQTFRLMCDNYGTNRCKQKTIKYYSKRHNKEISSLISVNTYDTQELISNLKAKNNKLEIRESHAKSRLKYIDILEKLEEYLKLKDNR